MSTKEHEAAADLLARELLEACVRVPDAYLIQTMRPLVAAALADAVRVAREEDALRHCGSTDDHYCGVCDTVERNAVIRQRKLTAAIAQRAGEGDATAKLKEKAMECPTCASPRPFLHPAVQEGGEVQPCPDAWHFHANGAGHTCNSMCREGDATPGPEPDRCGIYDEQAEYPDKYANEGRCPACGEYVEDVTTCGCPGLATPPKKGTGR